MELVLASELADRLFIKHGLMQKGWLFKFDRAKRRLGQCTYGIKTITLSKHMALAGSREQVEQALLHEIAHALLPFYDAHGKTVGHGSSWKAKSASIGYKGERLAHNPYVDDSRYVDSRSTRKLPVKLHTIAPVSISTLVDVIVVGDNISTLGTHKRFSGKTGKITGIGPKRFRVKLDNGLEIYVPPQFVAKT